MNNIIYNSINKSNFLIYTSTLGLIVYYYIPFFSSLNSFIRIGVTGFLILLFYLGILIKNKKIFIKTILTTLIVFAFSIIQYFSQWADTGIGFAQKTYFSFIIWFPFIQMIFLTSEKNIKISKMITFAAIATCTLTAITTIIGLYIYPFAARELAGARVLDIYYRMNIGGYAFIYTLVFFIPLLMYAYKQSKAYKIIYLLIIIVFYLCILKSQYTTATIMSLLMLPLILKKNINIRNLFGMMTIFILFFWFYKEKMGIFILNHSNVFSNYGLAFLEYRFNQIGNSLIYSELIGGAYNRGELYWKSINAFMHYPLTGVWVYPSSTYNIGGHSSIFDLLGSAGLIGGLFFLIIIYVYIKRKKIFLKGYLLDKYITLLSLIILIFACINTVFSSSLSMLFFVVSYNFYFFEIERKSFNSI